MLHAIEGGGIRAYFEPDFGGGLGARDFAWTAALALRDLAYLPVSERGESTAALLGGTRR
jgi:hypothetical protein